MREGYKMNELGELLCGWKKITLSQIFEIVNDKSKQIKSLDYQNVGRFPIIDQSSEFICGYTDDKSKIIKVKSPLIVFGDHTKHVKYIDFNFAIGADGTQLLKAKHQLNNKFFYFLVCKASEEIGNYGYDRHLKHLKNHTTIIPESIDEQHRIAEILSTVDDTIERTEALIEKYRDIKKGLMADLLTRGIDEEGRIRSEEIHIFKDSPLGRIPEEWEVDSIENFLNRIIDYRGKTPNKTEWGIPLLTAKNVREGYLAKEPEEFIATKDYETWMTRGIPDPEDVMFTTEAPLGNVAMIPNGKIALAQRIIVLSPNKLKLYGKFILYALMFPKNKTNIELKSTGSTVIGVKQSEFRKVNFSIPKLQEQQRIIKILTATDKRIEKEEVYTEPTHSRQVSKPVKKQAKPKVKKEQPAEQSRKVLKRKKGHDKVGVVAAKAPDSKLLPREAIMDIIYGMREKGATYDDVATQLISLGQPTFSGRGEWHAQTIHRLCTKK